MTTGDVDSSTPHDFTADALRQVRIVMDDDPHGTPRLGDPDTAPPFEQSAIERGWLEREVLTSPGVKPAIYVLRATGIGREAVAAGGGPDRLRVADARQRVESAFGTSSQNSNNH